MLGFGISRRKASGVRETIELQSWRWIQPAPAHLAPAQCEAGCSEISRHHASNAICARRPPDIKTRPPRVGARPAASETLDAEAGNQGSRWKEPVGLSWRQRCRAGLRSVLFFGTTKKCRHREPGSAPRSLRVSWCRRAARRYRERRGHGHQSRPFRCRRWRAGRVTWETAHARATRPHPVASTVASLGRRDDVNGDQHHSSGGGLNYLISCRRPVTSGPSETRHARRSPPVSLRRGTGSSAKPSLRLIRRWLAFG